MKIAPILRALEARTPAAISSTLVHTNQHHGPAMSDVFFRQLRIRDPDVRLEAGPAVHGAEIARVMEAFETHLRSLPSPPRGIVVVGDVDSTLAAALVGAKLGIPVSHVEAGLRSYDRRMPEEQNRIVIDAVADLLLVSEPAGLANLAAEGVRADKIRYVGNVMIDTLVAEREEARALGMATRMNLPAQGFALVTVHRPSNVDARDRLAAVVEFLVAVGARLPVVFAVHPRTDRSLRAHGLRGRLAAAVHLVDPLGYRENRGLMEQARLVISDSGGIQEETTYLGVPCITLRSTTERPVTVTTGTNTVTEDLTVALAATDDILAGRGKEARPIDGWDGRAAERVVDALLEAW